jgi:hypothetical protein
MGTRLCMAPPPKFSGMLEWYGSEPKTLDPFDATGTDRRSKLWMDSSSSGALWTQNSASRSPDNLTSTHSASQDVHKVQV